MPNTYRVIVQPYREYVNAATKDISYDAGFKTFDNPVHEAEEITIHHRGTPLTGIVGKPGHTADAPGVNRGSVLRMSVKVSERALDDLFKQ